MNEIGMKEETLHWTPQKHKDRRCYERLYSWTALKWTHAYAHTTCPE